MIIRSTSISSTVFRWFIIMTEEEEEKLARLEKRLVANVDFDDQALNLLGFDTNIYYMLGHLGWVQFFNRVSANTHKEFALEILMIVAHILDEGVSSLSFRLEGVEQVVPYDIRELLRFQKGSPGTSGCAWSHMHYVKTSNRSRNICNGPLTPVTSTHIYNGCYLVPVTYKRARTTPGVGLHNARYQCGLLVTGFLNARYINSL
jgi:hypothetical protein